MVVEEGEEVADEGGVGLDVGIDQAEQLAVVAHGPHPVEGDAVGDHGVGRHVEHLDHPVRAAGGEALHERDLLGRAAVGDEAEPGLAPVDLAGDEEPQVGEDRPGPHHVAHHVLLAAAVTARPPGTSGHRPAASGGLRGRPGSGAGGPRWPRPPSSQVNRATWAAPATESRARRPSSSSSASTARAMPGHVAARDDQRGLVVDGVVARPAVVGGDQGRAAGHRLDRGEAEALLAAGLEEHLGLVEHLGRQRLAAGVEAQVDPVRQRLAGRDHPERLHPQRRASGADHLQGGDRVVPALDRVLVPQQGDVDGRVGRAG